MAVDSEIRGLIRLRTPIAEDTFLQIWSTWLDQESRSSITTLNYLADHLGLVILCSYRHSSRQEFSSESQ